MHFQQPELDYISFVFVTNYENFDTLYEHMRFAHLQLINLKSSWNFTGVNIVQMGLNTLQGTKYQCKLPASSHPHQHTGN